MTKLDAIIIAILIAVFTAITITGMIMDSPVGETMGEDTGVLAIITLIITRQKGGGKHGTTNS